MKIKTIASIAIIVLVLGAGYAVAESPRKNLWNSMMGGIGGMMGWNGNHGMMSFNNGMMSGGMMGQYAEQGMMGGRGYNGMMNGYCGGYDYGTATNEESIPLTIEKASDSVEKYLATTGIKDLSIAEVIEFEKNFYASIKEKNTGNYAFELLVNKYTGVVYPEMGPNMMWNTKYGHMQWNNPAEATITKEQAVTFAQAYLDKEPAGLKTGDADNFYGYYTIEVLKGGKISGMLSVNAYSGAVWYHNWHGAFVKILEAE